MNGKVMGFARSAAHRAGKQGATVGFDLEMQLVGLPGHIRSRWPTSFHGGVTPSPRARTSLPNAQEVSQGAAMR